MRVILLYQEENKILARVTLSKAERAPLLYCTAHLRKGLIESGV
jgi:hypothetical protein